jgi:hypothetical protein
MTAGRGPPFSLSRWSRRKLEAAMTAPVPAASPASIASAPASAPAASAQSELPPVESLTFESDFTAFLRPEVDDKVKRAALKQLFRDPRFNVMDGLDTYIDDYTKADPIPEDVLTGLLQRFVKASADEAPVVAADAGGLAAEPPQPSLSPASGGESARAERGAGEGDVPSPTSGAERAPAERSAGEVIVPPVAGDEGR